MSNSEILSDRLSGRDHQMILDLEWGDCDDYYPPEEVTPERRKAWTEAVEHWDALRDRLLGETDDSKASAILDEMAQEEREWGDSPLTNRLRAILDRAGILGEED